MPITRVCVYCASSEKCDRKYFEAAARLGDSLARANMTIVYGGGRAGLMGSIADAALAAGGHVLGVLPRFMNDVEWGHPGLQELRLVEDMHDRLRIMKQESHAFVALPGGSGTLDELFQTITWKRLGLHLGPVIILNQDGFYDPTLDQLRRCIAENFMHEKHAAIWTVVTTPEEVVPALPRSPRLERDNAGCHYPSVLRGVVPSGHPTVTTPSSLAFQQRSGATIPRSSEG